MTVLFNFWRDRITAACAFETSSAFDISNLPAGAPHWTPPLLTSSGSGNFESEGNRPVLQLRLRLQY